MTSLTSIYRKWSLAVDRQRGLTLTAEELDLITGHGVFEALSEASAAELREVVEARQRERDAK